MVRRRMMISRPDTRAADAATRRFVEADGTPMPGSDPATTREDTAIAELWDAIGWIDVVEDIPAPPVARRARRGAWPARESASRRRPSLGWAAAAGVVLAMMGFGGAAWLHRPTDYATGVGEQRTLALADGSQITLNTDTQIAVRIDGGARHVDLLRGEAFFHVAKRAGGDPFVVTADATRVRVTGTQFDVRRLAHGVDVDVLEGHVRVGPGDDAQGPDSVALMAAQGVTTDAAGRPGSLRPADAARARYWRAGDVYFQSQTLGRAAAEMNRYSRVKLVVADPDLAALPVSGVFRAGAVTSFAQALGALYGVQAVPNGDTLTLTRAPAKAR